MFRRFHQVGHGLPELVGNILLILVVSSLYRLDQMREQRLGICHDQHWGRTGRMG